ncbi:MAG: glycosyltransferase family 4 protein [Chitinophagaceae bacterium]|nr:glycosyltransferase family 4 protein [Chitinophagaceae bacterium]
MLIEELAKDPELDITVIHPHPGGVFNNPVIKEIGVEGIQQKNNYLLECYRYSARVAAALKTLSFDVVYSQGLCVWAEINLFREKLIINPHGLEPYQAIGVKNKLIAIPFKIIFNYLFNKATAVVSLGGKLTYILSSRIQQKSKIYVLPNGVHPVTEVFTKKVHKKIVVLFFARFAHNKGINILFDALEELDKRGELKHFDFVLGGKGPLFEHYKKQNRFENVQISGFIPDEAVPVFYRQGDVFILPTLFEGMPTVVLEAMTNRLPVIVSDVGATAELVNGENGFLIRKNSAMDLADALAKFKNLDSNTKEIMGLASQRMIMNKFTWQKVAEKHKQLFYTIGQGRPTI